MVILDARIKFCSLLVVGMMVFSCSPRRAAEALLLGDDFTRTPNLTYGDGTRQRLDVYQPKVVPMAAAVVVFLYGGRWREGSKDEYRLLGDSFTRKGWIAVIPSVRNFPDGSYPAWVEDAAQAVRWTHDNIKRYGGDPEKIFVVGHSSGAHTTMMLATDERFLEKAGLPYNSVKGFASLAGPVRTTWTFPDVQAVMGPVENWPASYPVNHIDGKEAPILLLHGGGDKTVSPQNSKDLAADIQQKGGCARLILYPNISHFGIIKSLVVPDKKAPVLNDLNDFIVSPKSVACRLPR